MSHQFNREFEETVNVFFKGLRFNAEKHEYHVEERKVPKSVSGVIHSFVEEVDFDAIAQAIDRRDGLAAGTTKAAWAAKTAIACADGTATHEFGENFQDQTLIAETKKQQAVVKFWDNLNKEFPGRYFLVTKEQRMYHKIFFFSGTCDFIIFDRLLLKFIIGDYKTNEDLFKNHKGKMMLSPFDHLLDCPYNHYQVQLSLYQVLLEQIEGYKVAERWLVYLQADGESKVYKTYDYASVLEQWLQEKNQNQYSMK